MFVIRVKQGVYFKGDFEDDIVTDDLQKAKICENEKDVEIYMPYCEEWYKGCEVVEVEIKIKE